MSPQARRPIVAVDCYTNCACPSPVKTDCGCVNHHGGEITYCPTHALALEMAVTLRVCAEALLSLAEAAGDDQRFNKGGEAYEAHRSARALLARLDEHARLEETR